MNLNQKLKIGLLSGSLAALTACDSSGDVELAKTEYEGRVTIRLVQEVQFIDNDDYILEVQDSTGTVIASMESVNREPEAQLKVDGKTYDLRDRGYRVGK